MLCLHCLNITENTDTCECGSASILEKNRNKYYFNGQVYSRKEWLAKMAGTLIAGRNGAINPEYLRDVFTKNASIHTFVRLVLPAILFLLMGAGIVIGLLVVRYIDERVIMLAFFAFILFFLGIINLKRGLIDRIKIVALPRGRRFIHQQFSYTRYQKILNK
jgi:hypothetical protein